MRKAKYKIETDTLMCWEADPHLAAKCRGDFLSLLLE